jgi:hypothetical protein
VEALIGGDALERYREGRALGILRGAGLYTVPGGAVCDLSHSCLSARPSHCVPTALRGVSGGAIMTIPGVVGTLAIRGTSQLPYVLGAPASLIEPELSRLLGSGPPSCPYSPECVE